jgi:hypothetical protein
MKALVALLAGLLTTSAWAHHSYAMFDGTRRLKVVGTVAKLEWMNPHVFIWVYVPNPKSSTGYELYGFSNASTNVLSRAGWTPSTLKPGEKVTVEYWPLKDGRTGGQFIQATHEDGHVTVGKGAPDEAKASQETTGGK